MVDGFEQTNTGFLNRAGAPGNSRPTMVITGGSGGLGRELVRRFAGDYNVIFGWLNSADDAESLFGEMQERGDWVLPFQCDMTDHEQVEAMASRVKEVAADCQVLVHTTGVFSMKPLDEMDTETWRLEMDSTVSAGFFAWQAFASQLKTHERSRVVFIGDSAAEHLRAKVRSTGYYIGKHGLVLLARTIARENQSTGLTCNVVSPGVLPNSIDLDEPGMKVNVEYEEIAGVVGFLLSPGADAVSGSNVVASRGWNV
jgi:3-oxoacyl-[acyl-carrier protein] reductase